MVVRLSNQTKRAAGPLQPSARFFVKRLGFGCRRARVFAVLWRKRHKPPDKRETKFRVAMSAAALIGILVFGILKGSEMAMAAMPASKGHLSDYSRIVCIPNEAKNKKARSIEDVNVVLGQRARQYPLSICELPACKRGVCEFGREACVIRRNGWQHRMGKQDSCVDFEQICVGFPCVYYSEIDANLAPRLWWAEFKPAHCNSWAVCRDKFISGQLDRHIGGFPELQSSPSEPKSSDDQAPRKKYEGYVSGLSLAGKFDNPTVGFFMFIVCLILSFACWWAGLSQIASRRSLGISMIVGVALFAVMPYQVGKW
jgi:hypothetical protein